jgi:hypothetical protein
VVNLGGTFAIPTDMDQVKTKSEEKPGTQQKDSTALIWGPQIPVIVLCNSVFASHARYGAGITAASQHPT